MSLPQSTQALRKPNFFLVGAPRCGTTALYTYLNQHPDIAMPRYDKEPHYFGRDLVAPRFERFRDKETKYRELWSHGQGCPRLGEGSVYYLLSQTAAQEIAAYKPDAKIIIAVRNPIEMLYSYYQVLYNNGDEPLPTFEAALAAEAERKQGKRIPPNLYLMPQALYYRDLARFSEQIARYDAAFGREQVHIIVFDDFKADTAGVYRSVLSFLEVDPTFAPEFTVVNAGYGVRSPLLQGLLRNPMLVRLGDWLRPIAMPIYRVVRQWNTVQEDRAPLLDRTKRQLQAEFAPEVEQLSARLQRDLSHWLRE